MSDQPDSEAAHRTQSEAAASRRWLITIMITVVFGGFGAVIAYLNYARRSEPSISSPSTSPSTAPASSPATEPTTPAPADDDKGKGNKNK